MMPDLFIDLAKGMERGCFDYMIIEDSSNVPYTYKGSHDTYLQYAASAPKLDPAVLVLRPPGTLVFRIDGFADRDTVAQAATNAAT